MLRFIVKEVYVGHVVHADGQPQTTMYTIDADVPTLEALLRLSDQPRPSEYLTRELLGVELLSDRPREGAQS